MATEYQLRIKNVAGETRAIVTDFVSLAFTKGVNVPGLARFELHGDDAAIGELVDKGQVEIWRRNRMQGVEWYCDFYGLYREMDRTGGRPGRFVAMCPGQLSMLGWRIVAWPAGTADRSAFVDVAAETIMKRLVDFNAGGSATVGNGRLRAGTIVGISTEADGGGGSVVDWYCAYDNVLETLQALALIGGGDFDLVKTGAQGWVFRFYPVRLGMDRSDEVIFSLAYDNMAKPRYRIGRLGERTVAIVGGQGEGDLRELVIRSGGNFGVNNDTEMFVDGRNMKTTAGLVSKGDAELEKVRGGAAFSFDVLQTAASLYGKHYFLGDLVTAVNPFTGVEVARKIVGVTVSVKNGVEEIGVETADE